MRRLSVPSLASSLLVLTMALVGLWWCWPPGPRCVPACGKHQRCVWDDNAHTVTKCVAR